MKRSENPYQEAKQLLHPIKNRPDLHPEPEFLNELERRISKHGKRKRPKVKRYPLFAIASVILIFTIVVLSFQNQELILTSDKTSYPIAEKSQLKLIDSFEYGDGEGEVGLYFQGIDETLPISVSAFDIKNGAIYILDEAHNQVLIRKEGITTSFPIETNASMSGGLEDILVADDGTIYILNVMEYMVYQYNEAGEIIETYNYSTVDMFFPDGLFEFVTNKIVLSQVQEKFVDLDTMTLLEGDLPYYFERVNRKENRLIYSEDGEKQEITIFEDLGIDNRSVLAMNEEQILVTQTVSPPVYEPVSETHVLALNKEGEVLGGVRIPVEDFLEQYLQPEKYLSIDGNKVYLLIPGKDQVSLFELTIGKQFERFIEEQAEAAKVGFDYQTFGKPFPELENKLNDLLANNMILFAKKDSLNGVAINEEGTVIIDFKDFLDGGPASAQSQELLLTLSLATFESFSEIQEIYFQFDGSFSAWCYWLGGTEESWKRQEAGRFSLANSYFDFSEYSSMEEWMQELKLLIKSKGPSNTDKESYETHIGAMSVIYANYYLNQTEQTNLREKLYLIKNMGLQLAMEIDADRRLELLDELYNVLDN